MRLNSLLVNAGMNGLAQGLGKVVRFVITSIALVKFGAASWGEVAFALTLVAYLNFVLDFGLSSLALIEHPDDVKMDRKLFVALGYLRGFLILGMAIIGLLVFIAMDFPGGFVLKAYLLQIFLRPFNLDWWLSRKGYAGINPMVQFVRQAIILGIMWAMDLPSIEYFVAMDIASEVLATAALWFIGPKRKFSVGVPSKLEFKDAWSCYRGSFILFVSSSLLLLHQNVDIFFLKYFCGNASVGIYDYCYRYALFVFILGGSLSVPLRRQLARLWEFGKTEDSADLVFCSHRILGVMSASFLFGTIALSDIFFSKVIAVGAEFHASKVIVFLACWLVVAFYSVPWSEWLISRSRRDYLKLALVAGVVNVVSNTLLVPRYGLSGAAMAKILSESGIFLFLFFKVPSDMRRRIFKVGSIHVVLLPAVVIFLMNGCISPWLLGGTAIVEVLMMWFVRYISPQDLKILSRN